MARNRDRVLLNLDTIDSTTLENVKLDNQIFVSIDFLFKIYFLFSNFLTANRRREI